MIFTHGTDLPQIQEERSQIPKVNACNTQQWDINWSKLLNIDWIFAWAHKIIEIKQN